MVYCAAYTRIYIPSKLARLYTRTIGHRGWFVAAWKHWLQIILSIVVAVIDCANPIIVSAKTSDVNRSIV